MHELPLQKAPASDGPNVWHLTTRLLGAAQPLLQGVDLAPHHLLLVRLEQDYIKNMELYKITARLLGNVFSIAILLRLQHMAQKDL